MGCPLNSCCCCIPLKAGTILIALLGILPTVACLYFATPEGQKFLIDNGVENSKAIPVSYVYCAIGICVFCSHVLLLVAAYNRLQRLFIIYLGSTIPFILISMGLAILISHQSVQNDHMRFGVMFFILSLIYNVILSYFWCVVKSQLYVEKEESNVVKIYLTIIWNCFVVAIDERVHLYYVTPTMKILIISYIITLISCYTASHWNCNHKVIRILL